MTRRAAFRQSDVKRLIKGALAAGLTPGSFQLQVVDGNPTILPFTPGQGLTPAQDCENRMREAFGEP